MGSPLATTAYQLNYVKILSKPVSIQYLEIVNESFLTGVFPDKEKIAKVVPHYKSRPQDNPSNYRQSLSFVSFWYILMHSKFYKFFDVFDVPYPVQFGFRESIVLIMHL